MQWDGRLPYYYHQNWQYSVVGYVSQRRDACYAWEYDPYGGFLLFRRQGSAVTFTSSDHDRRQPAPSSYYENPFTYTGQRLDPESGLMYYKHRYYDAARGRFLSRDPLLENVANDSYTYVSAIHH